MTVGAIIPSLKKLATRTLGAAGGAVFAAVLGFGFTAGGLPAHAQDYDFNVSAKPGAQMLVESDELVYDYDRNTVSAVGNVKIYYVGYTLQADQVTYFQTIAKLVASGSVQMTDPSGIVFYAEEIDITDDFREGFVGSLRVDTPEDTYFAAESAERIEGNQTVFYNGVYTACEPCKDRPEKPPFWQVKSAKIVVNDEEKTVEFHNASFEFFGMPMAWVPYFEVADPTVRRKTGFLAPEFGNSDNLGWSVSTPYFIALAPSYDITLTPTYYTKQGFMGEIEWRQRLRSGQYTIQMAGIDQNKPKAFLTDDGGGTYAQRDFRGAARTTGKFDINKWWEFGWDGTISTDRTFTRDYSVINTDTAITTSEVRLTGLRDRSYMDIRAEHFQVLTDRPSNPKYNQDRQALITPVMDYNRVFDTPILGGQVSNTSNLTVLTRDEADPFTLAGETYYRGLAGDYVRLTEQIDWEKQVVIPGGQLVTAFASLRGDVFSIDPTGTVPNQLTSDDLPTRFMPSAGVEWRMPIMAATQGSTHIFEPMAQLIVRPDEQLAGKLENDDAQSLVFDDTTLMQRDKFSGFDRVEGGTRVNYGFRYAALFDNGWGFEGIVGQSRHLAGLNSYAVDGIAAVGPYSGLETDASDYVGRVSLDSGSGIRVSMRGRFDQEDLSVNMSEVTAGKYGGNFSAAIGYIYQREQPTAGQLQPTSQVTGRASLKVFDQLRVYGSAIYDLDESNLRKNSLGLAYDNSCVSLSIAYTETRGTDIPDRSIGFRLTLRTLAEGAYHANIN